MANDSSGETLTDAERLKRLYDERVPSGMSQAEFGANYGIGSKAMVWQYLTGYRPLNFEAAAKFARGLKCTIADISPEMARKLRVDIFPVLGRVSIKTAIALMLAIPPLLQTKTEAAGAIFLLSDRTVYYVKLLFHKLCGFWHQDFLTVKNHAARDLMTKG